MEEKQEILLLLWNQELKLNVRQNKNDIETSMLQLWHPDAPWWSTLVWRHVQAHVQYTCIFNENKMWKTQKSCFVLESNVYLCIIIIILIIIILIIIIFIIIGICIIIIILFIIIGIFIIIIIIIILFYYLHYYYNYNYFYYYYFIIMILHLL